MSKLILDNCFTFNENLFTFSCGVPVNGCAVLVSVVWLGGMGMGAGGSATVLALCCCWSEGPCVVPVLQLGVWLCSPQLWLDGAPALPVPALLDCSPQLLSTDSEVDVGR